MKSPISKLYLFLLCSCYLNAFINETRFESRQKLIGLQEETSLFRSPHSLSDDQQGNLYVTDFQGKQILRFDPEGAFLGEFATDQTITKPLGICIGKNIIAITDDHSHTLSVFDKSGNTIWKTAGRGREMTQLLFPKGLATNKNNNNILVADYGNLRIQEFSASGSYVKSFIYRSPHHNISLPPRAIAIYNDELFALYPESLEIGVFNLHTTELLRTFSNQTIAQKPFISPKDLTISPDGYLFISDEGKNSIIVLDVQGNLQDIINISSDGPENSNQLEGINCDQLGNLYVTDKKNLRIIMFVVRKELRLARQAHIHFTAGRLEEAIELCENLLRLNPQNEKAVEMIENSLRMMITKALSEHDNPSAKKLLQRLLDFNPSNKFAQRRIRLLRWAENKGWMKYAFGGLSCFLIFFALLLTVIEHLQHKKPIANNDIDKEECNTNDMDKEKCSTNDINNKNE